MSRFVTVQGPDGIFVVALRERNRKNRTDGVIVARCYTGDDAYIVAEALTAAEESERCEISTGEFGYG